MRIEPVITDSIEITPRLPVVVFGLGSTLCLSFSYFCFSNIVGFIVTPAFEFISLNVERPGTNAFKPSESE